MLDPWEESELAGRFREVASTAQPRAPLYAALADGIARRPELSGLLVHAPAGQRLPVLLFACVHALLLDEPDHELAAWYPNLTAEPRSPHDRALMRVFSRFVDDRASSLLHLLGTRRTQTNEVGRCALLLPPIAGVSQQHGPVALVDVGTSAGLTLLVDRYTVRFHGPDGSIHTVGPGSSVVVDADVRGPLPLPAAMPEIATRCGIDVAPIDVTSPAEARWLEACVWPDQPDRFARLRAAIALARETPPEILQGDAVASIGSVVERLSRRAHPVVTTTWVLNYLDADGRRAFVGALDEAGAAGDLSWVLAESPDLTAELPWRDDPGRDRVVDGHLTHLTLVTWRGGRRTVRTLATCHPHGYWIRSVDDPD